MKKYIFLILILVRFLPAFPDEQFSYLEEDSGLSSRRCFSIKQDKNGFIWIATKFSIDRYDGYHFVRYQLNSPTGEPLQNIDTNLLCLAPDSTLWAFNHSGYIYKYNEQTDAFELVYATSSYYHANILINHLFFNDDNSVYIATMRGILCLDLETKKIKYSFLDNENVNHILKENDLLYISTIYGLYIVRLHDKKVINLLLRNVFTNTVYYDAKFRRFWIGTFSNGMYILPQDAAYSIKQVKLNIFKPIRSIIPYNETQIAAGIDGEGILLINRETMNIEAKMVYEENSHNSFQGASVNDLMLDKQKNLWAATYHSGVIYTNKPGLTFRNFTHIKDNKNSVVNNYINVVYEDTDGDIWLGTNNGISIFYRKTGQWKHLLTEPKSINKNVILTLCEISKGKMWAGGYAFGIAEINKKTGRIKLYNYSPSSFFGTKSIYSIYQNKYSGDIWTGGIYGKISCYNPKTQKQHFYNAFAIRCFDSFNDSIVALGTNNGFILLNQYTKKVQQTRIDKLSINSILKDSDKAYWIATMSDGLFYYDLKNDSLRNYNQSNGLSSNHIYSIEKDEENNLWISSEKGLNKLNPSTGKIVYFTKSDGLASDKFLPNSSFRCSTGELLFGGMDGTVLFNPSKTEKNNITSCYPLMILDFSIFDVPVKAGVKNSPLTNTINNTSEIRLPHNQNYFSFTFTLPNYQTAYKTEYSCFLEGHDLDWSNPTSYNKVSYSKLLPGKYKWIIRAYIEKQLQEERTITIIINQPWWNTIWAWALYTLIAVIAIYWTIKYYEEYQKKKQTEEKIDFFINTAHDILTPLNLIEAPLKDISLMESFSTEVQYRLSLVLSNCRILNHFIHQLIDFQKIMLNAEQLVVRKNNLQNFFIYKKNTYQTVASQKFISLNFHIAGIEQEVYFDKEKLNKIVDNLLSNAIKYTPFGGTIEVCVNISAESWNFSVRDTGSGISKKYQKMIFKHIFREDNEVNAAHVGSGTGLKMVNTLVKIHQGKISFSTRQGIGSEFIITFPMHYKNEFIDFRPDTTFMQKDTDLEQKIKDSILIVDPNEDMNHYLSKAFESKYNVTIYNNASQALAQLIRINPQFIIVNSILSDIDGLVFCKKIKDNKNTQHIPVIMILETSDDALEKKILSSGITDYIHKPFDFEVLNLKISNILALQKNSRNKVLADMRKNNLTVINNNKDQEFMDNLILFIEKNLDNPELNVAMLCNEFALSRTLLYNRITKLTNSSPNEFIRTIRLKHAANLLLSGKYNVTEISYMVGIDNPKYFSRIFKEYYNISPKDYGK
jgi:signal transduction histidine kinase/ligand-binding sensor domain-containing protein/DNA-binding response OmpR family regulator